jgi:ABC-type nitrate/sulfonate/bicarbonate transport system permease component
MKKILIISIGIVVFVSVWQVVETKLNISRVSKNETSLEAFIPSPVSIVKSFINDGGTILFEMKYTFFRAALGLLVGIGAAFLMFFILLLFPSLRSVIFPVTIAINSFPIVGLVPVIILAFGQGSWLAIVFVSALISYFPILISLDYSIKNTDNELVDVMTVLNASKKQIISKVYIPLALPNLFSSLRLAISASIIGATIGEWLGIRTGIGQLITVALYQLKPALLYASLISIVLVSIILVWLLSFSEKYLLPWKHND